MSISGTQCREVGCPQTALNCSSICACWNEKKELSTSQLQHWNDECHTCKPVKGVNLPLMVVPLPQLNSEEDAEILEKNEDN
jgi:hypothetical protein